MHRSWAEVSRGLWVSCRKWLVWTSSANLSPSFSPTLSSSIIRLFYLECNYYYPAVLTDSCVLVEVFGLRLVIMTKLLILFPRDLIQNVYSYIEGYWSILIAKYEKNERENEPTCRIWFLIASLLSVISSAMGCAGDLERGFDMGDWGLDILLTGE